MSAEEAARSVQFRDAIPGDASDLALLADASSRRLYSYLWASRSAAGQSPAEVGRTSFLNDTGDTYHYSLWRAAQVGGRLVGGLNSYLLSAAPAVDSCGNPVLLPLAELKALAVDSWYIANASVFPEFRGQGVGNALLNEAERIGSLVGAPRLGLMVGSFNPRALALYERFGFSELARKPFVPFPGSDSEGSWILMIKDIAK